MTLQITKNVGKPHLVLYRRDNGSETWMHADDFFVLHDMGHYAIEKTLGYKTAFFGMINNGMDVGDFENREKRKQIPLTDEAVWAENMANLFLIEQLQGEFEDFNQTFSEAIRKKHDGVEPPVLGEMDLRSIRNELRSSISAWKSAIPGTRFFLEFDTR